LIRLRSGGTRYRCSASCRRRSGGPAGDAAHATASAGAIGSGLNSATKTAPG
jgi:hypothetical protein